MAIGLAARSLLQTTFFFSTSLVYHSLLLKTHGRKEGNAHFVMHMTNNLSYIRTLIKHTYIDKTGNCIQIKSIYIRSDFFFTKNSFCWQ